MGCGTSRAREPRRAGERSRRQRASQPQHRQRLSPSSDDLLLRGDRVDVVRKTERERSERAPAQNSRRRVRTDEDDETSSGSRRARAHHVTRSLPQLAPRPQSIAHSSHSRANAQSRVSEKRRRATWRPSCSRRSIQRKHRLGRSSKARATLFERPPPRLRCRRPPSRRRRRSRWKAFARRPKRCGCRRRRRCSKMRSLFI